MSRAIPERAPSPPRHAPPYLNQTPPDDAEVFVFPDGDIFAESIITPNDDEEHHIALPDSDSADATSEAQWLDSLLESLADDDDPDFEQEPDDELISLSDISARSIDAPTPQIAPETVFLPPSPPLRPIQCSLYRYPTPKHLTCDTVSLTQEIEDLSLPDAVEDSASDTDTESINTPDSRSMSSLGEAAATRLPLVRIVDESVHPSSLYSYPFYPLPEFSDNEFTQEC